MATEVKKWKAMADQRDEYLGGLIHPELNECLGDLERMVNQVRVFLASEKQDLDIYNLRLAVRGYEGEFE